MAAVDLSVSFPSRGVIRLGSRALFGNVETSDCRRFLERVFQAPEIIGVTIRGGESPHAELWFRAEAHRLEQVVERVTASLRQGAESVDARLNGHAGGSDRAAANGSHTDVLDRPRRSKVIGPIAAARDRKGVIRYSRHGSSATGWVIQLDRPGRLRLKNRALIRKTPLCQAIEATLIRVLGIDQYRTAARTGTVQIDYDPAQLHRDEVIEILDSALAGAVHDDRLDERGLHLPLCTTSMPIAAVAQFAAPALLPVAAGMFACTSIPTFRAAYKTLVHERRLGADSLNAIVVIGCLGTMSIFPGAVLCWCLSVGQMLLKRAHDDSRKLLLDGFGKLPRHAWLCRNGAEVRVPLDRLEIGDLVVVNAGEVVPIDGRVVEGMAMIEQSAVTGESTPVEKGVGDRVFAATLMVAGKLLVSVEAAGSATASARIGRILDESAGHKLSYQQRGERLADRAVMPRLGLGAVGLATLDPGGAVALLSGDFVTGIRMAAPLAMLGSVVRCAHMGIVVTDGRALELMNEVDTVLFDKDITLTRERPEIRDTVEGLRRRGIEHIALISGDAEAPTRALAESLGMDRYFARVSPAAKADRVEFLQREGRTVCFVGDGIDDSIAARKADVSISLRGAASIATDAAAIIFLGEGPSVLCELRDIARDLDRNVKRSGSMTLAPHVACIVGVFTMGLGIMAAVVTSNVAALAALGNGVLPLRRAAQLEAERRHRLHLWQAMAANRASFEPRRDPVAPSPCTNGIAAALAQRTAAVYDVS